MSRSREGCVAAVATTKSSSAGVHGDKKPIVDARDTKHHLTNATEGTATASTANGHISTLDEEDDDADEMGSALAAELDAFDQQDRHTAVSYVASRSLFDVVKGVEEHRDLKKEVYHGVDAIQRFFENNTLSHDLKMVVIKHEDGRRMVNVCISGFSLDEAGGKANDAARNAGVEEETSSYEQTTGAKGTKRKRDGLQEEEIPEAKRARQESENDSIVEEIVKPLTRRERTWLEKYLDGKEVTPEQLKADVQKCILARSMGKTSDKKVIPQQAKSHATYESNADQSKKRSRSEGESHDGELASAVCRPKKYPRADNYDLDVDHLAGLDEDEVDESEEEVSDDEKEPRPSRKSAVQEITEIRASLAKFGGPTHTATFAAPRLPSADQPGGAYDRKKKTELSELCKQRYLPFSGNKAALIKRLENWDANHSYNGNGS